jgi:hypothetical protein
MKATLLAGVAVLFLATGTAHADDNDGSFEIHKSICSECQTVKAACEKLANKQHLRNDAKETFVDHCIDDYMETVASTASMRSPPAAMA